MNSKNGVKKPPPDSYSWCTAVVIPASKAAKKLLIQIAEALSIMMD